MLGEAQLARAKAEREKQKQTKPDPYTIGRELAKEQQDQKPPQPELEPEPQCPDRSAKPARNRGVEPWKRDWEKAQKAHRRQRTASCKEQERKASIRQNEVTRQEKKPQQQPPAPSQDERQLIEQWRQYHERERGESRASGQPDKAAKPARDTSLEQQNAKLRERMAEFEAEVEKLKQSQQPPPRRKREPPKEPEPDRDRHHERGISM